MPFFPSLSDRAGPPALFAAYPDIYAPWARFSEALMNGPSPLDRAQRELLLAYAAGLGGCAFVAVAHAEVAYALGAPRGIVERLLHDPAYADIDDRLRPIVAYLTKLVRDPAVIRQQDADAVLTVWDERALHDTIAIAARAAFMQRLVQGHGFVVPTREAAAKHAERRAQLGYVDLYPQFRGSAPQPS